MKKRLLRILLSLVLCASLCAVILSASAGPVQNSHMAYPIDTPYEYPVTPDSEEWFATDSHAARAGYCQIPEDILGKMSTAALVETVANYPLLGDLLFFNRAEDAYQSVSYGFNGLRELERRPDAVDELIRFLQSDETVQDDFVRRTALGVVVLAGDFPVPYTPSDPNDAGSLQDVFSDVYKCYRELAPA